MRPLIQFKLFFLAFLLFLAADLAESEPAPKNQEPVNIVFMIADDWSYPHAGVYGDEVVRTPTFDKLAREGVLFENAFCAAPSCSPSRAAILSGRYPHQLEDAGNLWSIISNRHPNWVSRLQQAGYHTGKSRKGWGPGDYERGGYEHNPAGKDYTDIDAFLKERSPGQPFCYWFGSNDPHRDYDTNSGIKTGMDPMAVEVPGFLPDLKCVRNDILDYYFEVERFDRECGNIINSLKEKGLLDNTMVVMTSDNGMPFPRAKANLYDYGTRMPLVIYWKGKVISGIKVASMVNLIDLAPTFLEAAGLEIPDEISGRSLLSEMAGKTSSKQRDTVFLERERHANVRKGNQSYPCRAVRTKDYLYIRNFEPDRWPAGDPETFQSVGQFGDIDNSISKFLIMRAGASGKGDYYNLAFGKRPGEELYILSEDPYNLRNMAAKPEYEAIVKKLRSSLVHWMRTTADRRLEDPQTTFWDEVEYTPDYQFENFDLQKEISEYRMLKKKGSNSYEAIPCME
ncbi:sulfatase family protein [Poritiphilus flavus]|uniref:Sulfatase-like hydrolase/transferase n=1 Tax=Poritiphilus flavus TaxID=2697053 RepID=A0A6L9E8V7_9FLAO|nr:sulfatase [Poritiphilus flavus]NAS11022.1 sulfatase-like hydrolase/transferase [Poritiphilus flavus]